MMKYIYRILAWSLMVGVVGTVCTSCTEANSEENDTEIVSSPDGRLQLSFLLEEGQPAYELSFNGNVIIQKSRLGFEFQQIKPLAGGMLLEGAQTRTVQDEWQTVWGERKDVLNHYNELQVDLAEDAGQGRQMTLYFRVFDDGLGFRYEIPAQDGLDSLRITRELTEFNFVDNHTVWYQECDTTDNSWENGYNTYERLYKNTRLSEVKMLMHTPATFELSGGGYASIHEANLTDYASMVLARGEGNGLKADLVPWPDGVKVKTTAPMVSPWRTIQVGEDLADLVESDLILNLNEPNQLADVSWIEPMKYVGIWWEMHLNKSTWEQGPNHGATTENTKKYIDFAAENGFGAVLVEGWNPGWEVWTTQPNFNFTEAYSDYDLPWLANYAQSKGVNLIGHHETSGDIITYEVQMPEAYALLQENGIHSVKTGYVGSIRPEGLNHHGQWMVNHYHRVVEMGAAHQINIVAHEPIKPTGLRRTYPNMMSREAMRGMEYNAWSTGNPPEHTTILPFTMLLAGPLDYTPGIFQTDLDAYRKGNSTHSTLANQLALYVTLYSPVQMAADLPEHYRNNPAFQFIRDVPTDWEDSKLLDGKIGDYVVIARKSRKTEDWFIGAITDENERELEVVLDFLPEGKEYTAQVYADEDDAHYVSNPMAIRIDSMQVVNGNTIKMKLAAGGGQAIRLKPIDRVQLAKNVGKE